MEITNKKFKETDTTKMFDKINILWHIGAMADFWIAKVQLPPTVQKAYKPYMKMLHYVLIVFIPFNAAAFLVQPNLKPNQSLDIIACGIILFMVECYSVVLNHNKAEIKKILYHLTVTLKEYNDVEVERKLLRKIKQLTYILMTAMISSLIIQGANGVIGVTHGEGFITFITIWPDVADSSLTAEVIRYLIYIIWYAIIPHALVVFQMITIIMITISHQYENLTSYFFKLNNIFEEDGKRQEEKEREYAKALLMGTKWHTITLWCVKRCQFVLRIIFNIHLTSLPLMVMVSLPEIGNPDIDTEALLRQFDNVFSALVTLALFMWNAGDITVANAILPDSIYGSGWQNCNGVVGLKVRSMVLIAMRQAQQPVVLTAFDSFEMSYSSYVTIVKATYSFVSVIAG